METLGFEMTSGVLLPIRGRSSFLIRRLVVDRHLRRPGALNLALPWPSDHEGIKQLGGLKTSWERLLCGLFDGATRLAFIVPIRKTRNRALFGV